MTEDKYCRARVGKRRRRCESVAMPGIRLCSWHAGFAYRNWGAA